MRTTTFGAFLEVEPGIEGLVHISQLAHERVEKTEDVVKPGDIVQVKVLAIDPAAKRMSLSIKETIAKEEPPSEDAPYGEDVPIGPFDGETEAVVEEVVVEETPAEEVVEEKPKVKRTRKKKEAVEEVVKAAEATVEEIVEDAAEEVVEAAEEAIAEAAEVLAAEDGGEVKEPTAE